MQIILLALGSIAGSYGTLALAQGTASGLGGSDIAAAVLLGGLLGLAVMYIFVRGVIVLVGLATRSLDRTSLPDLLAGVMGLLPGLLAGALVGAMLPRDLAIIGAYLPLTVTLAFGYTGMAVAFRKREEIFHLFRFSDKTTSTLRGSADPGIESPKILDTSVIIDGRILSVAKAGFLEGRLVVPGFVLRELQHIADSSDDIKRNRGRRGLDVLKEMQRQLGSPVEIWDQDFSEILEVDDKVVRLAKVLGGKVLTNDFNLNKVCELHGVNVLNLNDLANAVKPVALPGEGLSLKIVKDGKEAGQGVGYLEDGTMVVVEGGRRHIGETIAVWVTSVLQTSAGQLVFAKVRSSFDRIEQAL